MQTSTERMSYQNPPATDEAIPFGTAITPPTADHRLSKRMITIVVASIMVVAGGTVWMQGDPLGGLVRYDPYPLPGCWPEGKFCITCDKCCCGNIGGYCAPKSPYNKCRDHK